MKQVLRSALAWIALPFALLGQALANTPLTPPIAIEVESALRTNNPEVLKETLKRLSLTKGDVFELSFYKGLLNLKREQWDAALASFSVIPTSSAYYLAARNNMATVYASQGQLVQAKSTLEEALKAQQPLDLMYKNLNNLKTHIASKNYASALQILEGNTKLSLLVSTNGLSALTPKAPADSVLAAATKTPEVVTRPATTPAPTPVPPVATAPAPAPVPAPVATPAVAPPTPASPVPPAAERNADKKPANKPDAPSASSSEDDELAKGATQALQIWAQAWEKKDMDRYFGAYVVGFTPPDGKSNAQWVKDRQARILSKGNIKIQISQIESTPLGKNSVRLRYKQNYQADQLKVSSVKTVDMKLVDQRWLITSERASGGGGK
jgi:tetratricopeptide (TPR) repeat protein